MKVYNIGHLAKAFELKLQIERDNISIYFKEFRDQHFKAKVERLVVKIAQFTGIFSEAYSSETLLPVVTDNKDHQFQLALHLEM